MASGTIINPLVYVEMKVRRAQQHFEALNWELDTVQRRIPYTISTNEDSEKSLYVVRIEGKPMPEVISMLLGDFVCCLRSALDQLAWQLAVIGPGGMTKRDAEQLYFPIVHKPENWPPGYLKFFPKQSHPLIDRVQPYHRRTAFNRHPLWQLHELSKLDKHRMIPVNAGSLQIHFPIDGWEQFGRHLDYGFEVRFPLSMKKKFHLKPSVSSQILFGEQLGAVEITRDELGEINKFVREEAIRPFAGLFSKFVGVR